MGSSSAACENKVFAFTRLSLAASVIGGSGDFCSGGLSASISVEASPVTSARGALRSGETTVAATSGSCKSSGIGRAGGVSVCGFCTEASARACSGFAPCWGAVVAGFFSPSDEFPVADFWGPLSVSPNSKTGLKVGIGAAGFASAAGLFSAGGGGGGGGGGCFFACSGGLGSGGFSGFFSSGFFSSGGGTSSTFTLSSSGGFGSIFGSPKMRRAMSGTCRSTDAPTPQRISGRCSGASCASAGSTSSSVTAAMWPLKPAASSHKSKKPRDCCRDYGQQAVISQRHGSRARRILVFEPA